MGNRTPRGGRQDIEREIGEHATDEERQRRGSTPTEDVVERALEHEPGVEWHAGEDAGEVPDREDEESEMGTGANPT
jgi:hypothetical protein